MTRSVCQAAINIIKEAEGLRLKAYFCPAGIPTIGYGSTKGITADDVRNGKTIMIGEAEKRLAEDIAYAASQVSRAVIVPLTGNQYGALVSFCFNVGPGAKGVRDGFVTLKDGRASTMLRRLNEGQYALAAAEFPRWNKSNGKIMGGLVTRRAAEKALFLTPEPIAEAVAAEAVTVTPKETVMPAPEPVLPPTAKTTTVSEVGSGAKYSALGGFPVAWIIISLWNGLLPQNPMPLEVAMGLSSAISTGFYLMGDYISSRRVPKV